MVHSRARRNRKEKNNNTLTIKEPKTMANLRFEVVAEAFRKKPLEITAPSERPSEYFGKYVFNRAKMYKYLPV